VVHQPLHRGRAFDAGAEPRDVVDDHDLGFQKRDQVDDRIDEKVVVIVKAGRQCGAIRADAD